MATRQTSNLVETVIAEASRLQDFLSGLDIRAWVNDSTCEGWTISDVVTHLARSADSWATNITRAVSGDAGPPEGQSFLAPGERASHPTGPAARQSRQQSGTEILTAFTAGHNRLQKVLNILADDDWDKPCFHRRGALPIKAYLGVQLQELALHGWDIRWGLDSAAELWGASLPVLVDLIPRWLRTAFIPGLGLPTPVLYRFDVSSPLAVNEDLLVSGDAYEARASGPEPAATVFRCNTGNYILLMFGRLQVERAVVDGRLAIDGSLNQAMNFNAWFKGF